MRKGISNILYANQIIARFFSDKPKSKSDANF